MREAMFVLSALSRASSQGLRGSRIGGWRIGSRLFDFATFDALDPCFRWQIRNPRGRWRRTHPSGAPGTDFEAVP
eukprot:6692796-Alexandrium_andersonii.AAC.1